MLDMYDLNSPVSFSAGGGSDGGSPDVTSSSRSSFSKSDPNPAHDGPGVRSVTGFVDKTTFSNGITVTSGAYSAVVNIPGNSDGSIGYFAGRGDVTGITLESTMVFPILDIVAHKSTNLTQSASTLAL